MKSYSYERVRDTLCDVERPRQPTEDKQWKIILTEEWKSDGRRCCEVVICTSCKIVLLEALKWL